MLTELTTVGHLKAFLEQENVPDNAKLVFSPLIKTMMDGHMDAKKEKPFIYVNSGELVIGSGRIGTVLRWKHEEKTGINPLR